MSQNRVWLIVGIVSAVILLLCGASGVVGYIVIRDQLSIASAELDTISAASDTSTPDSTADSIESILLEDDFSDTSSGWYRDDYADGKYRLAVDQEYYTVWSVNRSIKLSRLEDVRIEVDVTQTEGMIDSSFGVVCRVDGEDMYSFEISSDGWYAITKAKGEDITLLVTAEEPSTAIKQDDGTNRIRGECIGDTLTLYINDEKVAEATDDEFRSGGAGMQISSYDVPNVVVEFDNIVISRP